VFVLSTEAKASLRPPTIVELQLKRIFRYYGSARLIAETDGRNRNDRVFVVDDVVHRQWSDKQPSITSPLFLSFMVRIKHKQAFDKIGSARYGALIGSV
jgi:hypothetical protein